MKSVIVMFGVKNSKEVLPGYIFFSILGKNFNGNDFIKEAVDRGASKIVIQYDNPLQDDVMVYLKYNNIPYFYVANIYYEFALCVKNAYKNVCDGITFFGVTGTKGKTSIAYAMYSLLRKLSYPVAIMSSIGHKIEDIEVKNSLTTEMVNDVYEFIKKSKNYGVRYIVIEVSAQAFSQFRVFGIEFDGFIFSNFSQEHQESYPNLNDYFVAKCQLYEYVKHNGFVILNKDDKKSLESELYYSKKLANKKINIRYYYNSSPSKEDRDKNTCCFQLLINNLKCSKTIIFYDHQEWIFSSIITGVHYISNIVSVIVLLYEILRLTDEQIKIIFEFLETFVGLPGRNEIYSLTNNRVIIIDKAYTPNSVTSLFEYIIDHYDFITVVFGCGGEKDVVKRPLIANIIEQYAEKIYVTADNPRNESLSNIFFDIAKGFSFNKDIFFIQDRELAIMDAINKAPENSAILLLGKGDEKYQIFGNEKIYFCEKEIIAPFIIENR